MTRIALVRHGQTNWNFEGRIQGSSDIPLNDTGRQQAREAGQRLAGHGFTYVVSSPLSRAVETASLLAGELGLTGPHERIENLAERRYGSAEGVTGVEFATRFPNGVPDAEDELAVVARTRIALLDLATRHPGETIAAASHGGVIGRLVRSLPDSGYETGTYHSVLNGSAWIFEVAAAEIRFVEELSPVEV